MFMCLMTIEPKFAGESPKDFVVALITTFGLPILFLVVDYVFRSQASQVSFEELVMQSGPDCCILSFGATGAVFMDSNVQSIPGLTSPIVLLFILAVILILRFLCLGASRKQLAERSLVLGLTSVFTVLLIPVVAFVARRSL